jgi:peptidoglycan/LPS O-acetylase OafA/YrhL
VNARRYDIDALRVGAFFLLILYHTGMFYGPAGWHVKSTYILPWLGTPMSLVNPWRLTLLFFISGIATRLMGDKLAVGALATQRSLRLLIPLIFGILIVVPPQSWAEVVEKKGYTGSLVAFWLDHYITFDRSFGLILPFYNHLWFVAYLWVYTMVAVMLWPLLPMLDRFAGRWMSGMGILVIPVLLLGASRAFIYPYWGETHVLWWDAYNHVHYLTAFFLGLMLAKQERPWTFLATHRLPAFIGVVVIAIVALSLSGIWEEKPGWRGEIFALIRAGYVWGAICVLLGYAHHYIRRGSPLLTSLTQAVFPFYIIHQTTIVLVGHFISTYRLPVALEASIIIAATAASCVAVYALARAVPLLRLPLGLQPKFAK